MKPDPGGPHRKDPILASLDGHLIVVAFAFAESVPSDPWAAPMMSCHRAHCGISAIVSPWPGELGQVVCAISVRHDRRS